MIMFVIALILFATLSINGEEQSLNAASGQYTQQSFGSNQEAPQAKGPVSEPISNTEEPMMNCYHDKCAESFNACYNDEKCKEFMLGWQQNKSLIPECSSSESSESSEEFETTDTISTTETTYDESTTSSPLSSISSTEDSEESQEESPCELFEKAYNCVDNNCYDQSELTDTHEYLQQSPSNYRHAANVTGSPSSSNNWVLLIVALSSASGAIVMLQITRKVYAAFQDKMTVWPRPCRYLKNKWEQIRGYKYEKAHDDLDTIEESDGDESITNKDTTATAPIYNEPSNTDSDISDDVELQRADDANVADDQFVHKKDEELIDDKDTKEQEITVEAVQEPIQDL